MHLFYNLAIAFYQVFVTLLLPFNKKAGLWYRGRKGFFSRWKHFDKGSRRLIWIHCASLGEFEQGRPVIEEIRRRDNSVFILLTFFSPSGYEVRKNYPLADAVCYLPADTPVNARKFLGIFKPDMVIFVKYEFWYNYIDLLGKYNIPLYLISANFRPDQIFFRWYGQWFAQILHKFTHIFVQSETSLRLLNSLGAEKASISGDTRFDRVHALASNSEKIGVAATFSAGSFTIVAGSTWPADHDLLVKYINETDRSIKIIIAPHEINEKEIEMLTSRFHKPVLRFSRASGTDRSIARVLIIDNIGILSSLYPYGDFAYIGGGFGKGIHNILEASTHGLPVIFGPKYKKFLEAVELVELGGAFPVKNYRELSEKVDGLAGDKNSLQIAGQVAAEFVRTRTGATRIIVDKIMPC
jgi:3-deoxy-D-manno-octulosonic-acid transferase